MLLLNRGSRVWKSKQYYGHNSNQWNSRIRFILLPAPWVTLMHCNIVLNRTYPLPPSQTPDCQTFPCRYFSQCLVRTSSGTPGRLVNRKEWRGKVRWCRCQEMFPDPGIMILRKKRSPLEKEDKYSPARRWGLLRAHRMALNCDSSVPTLFSPAAYSFCRT